MKSSKMRLSVNNYRALFFAGVIAICLAILGLNPRAGAQGKHPPRRAGHINDFAEIFDAATKERLEAVLASLKQKTDVDFVVATVKTTGGEDIYDYSLRVSGDWKVGAPTGVGRSVLLVIVADSGKL